MNVKVSETKESYSQILLSIERCISKSYVKFNSTSDEPLTLISGYAGNALFYGYAYKKFQDDYLLNQAFNLLRFKSLAQQITKSNLLQNERIQKTYL